MENNQQIKHLYARAGFGLSATEWMQKQHWSLDKALKNLFEEAKTKNKPLTEPEEIDLATLNKLGNLTREEKQEMRKDAKVLVFQQNDAWIRRMADEKESPLLEKMSLFWHGHFACRSIFPRATVSQLNTIRKHALGNFRDLVVAIAKDPAMIRYLNNQQNRKDHPNENFARELMELFTIGRGNYTENDIKEAARAFTGWSSNFNGEFVFKPRFHDFDSKTFMGKTGTFDGEDIIDIILAKPETAQFITRKIYRFFVNDTPNEAHIKTFSAVFYRSNYNIEALMRAIFNSSEFYEIRNIGNKIKSPMELIAGILRVLDVTFEDSRALLFLQKSLGQMLYNPPNVAGWAGGKAWIDNSTLMIRLNLATVLFKTNEVNFRPKEEFESTEPSGKRFNRLQSSVNLDKLMSVFSKEKEEVLLDKMAAFLLPANVKIDKKLFDVFDKIDKKEDNIRNYAMYLMSLPEYQLC